MHCYIITKLSVHEPWTVSSQLVSFQCFDACVGTLQIICLWEWKSSAPWIHNLFCYFVQPPKIICKFPSRIKKERDTFSVGGSGRVLWEAHTSWLRAEWTPTMQLAGCCWKQYQLPLKPSASGRNNYIV